MNETILLWVYNISYTDRNSSALLQTITNEYNKINWVSLNERVRERRERRKKKRNIKYSHRCYEGKWLLHVRFGYIEWILNKNGILALVVLIELQDCMTICCVLVRVSRDAEVISICNGFLSALSWDLEVERQTGSFKRIFRVAHGQMKRKFIKYIFHLKLKYSHSLSHRI